MPGAQCAAGAVRDRELAILDLARTAFVAQLLGRLDDEEDSAHSRMIRRQPATISIDGKRAIETDAPARNERPTLAALAKAKVLELRDHRDGEGVVDHAHVYIGMLDARALERELAGLRRRVLEIVAMTRAAMTHGFRCTEDIDGLLLQITRALGRRDDQRTAAIGNDAAIEQVQRRRNHARREHVLNRNEIAILGRRIHRRM